MAELESKRGDGEKLEAAIDELCKKMEAISISRRTQQEEAREFWRAVEELEKTGAQRETRLQVRQDVWAGRVLPRNRMSPVQPNPPFAVGPAVAG